MDLVFDERGLLPPGVHDVSMDEVKQHFGGFRRSDRRPKLFAKLLEYQAALTGAGIGGSLIIDGSFVMAGIEEPDDIDIVLVFPAGWDTQADLRPFQYNLVSKKSVKISFRLDLFTAPAGSAEENSWIEYFGRVNLKWREEFGWPPDTRKGILRVLL